MFLSVDSAQSINVMKRHRRANDVSLSYDPNDDSLWQSWRHKEVISYTYQVRSKGASADKKAYMPLKV